MKYIDVEYKKSPIHGIGIFTKELLFEGEDFDINITNPKFGNANLYNCLGYNHSCKPNIMLLHTGEAANKAIRDIYIGEELVVSYGCKPFSKCNCGNCDE